MEVPKTTHDIERPKSDQVYFFEENRNLFETIAGGNLTVEKSRDGGFAVDMKTGTVYVGDMFDKEGVTSVEHATTFATMHELSHMEEIVRLLGEQKGPAKFEQYRKRFGQDRAFATLDNCVADVRENRNVIQKTNAGFAETRDKMYEEVAFPSADLTISGNGQRTPRHIQFAQALLRESQLPDQSCVVDPEVREAVDKIYAMKNKAGKSFFQILTDPNLPMEKRWQLQDKYLVPEMEKLKEQDLEDHKDESGESENGGSDQSGEESDSGKGDGRSPGDGSNQSAEAPDPNEIFKGDYDEMDEKVGSPLKPEDFKKMLDDYRETHKDEADPLDAADQRYADKLGVKKTDLQKYRDLAKKANELINTKTREKVVDELENLIQRIIVNRKKMKPAPKYPQEEGDYLVDPGDLVASAYAGNLTPKVWESTEMREKRDKKTGKIELTLVCDGSGSMDGEKSREQLTAAVLMMETLKRFQEAIDDARSEIYKQLEISSEIYKFGDDNEAKRPIKPMSPELTEKQRIDAMVSIGQTNGLTNDFDSLSAIRDEITDETRDKIKSGEMKKIVIVMTDGDSNNTAAVQDNLEKLRADGVVVVGVGITNGGKSVLQTYAPDAQVAEHAEALSVVLANLLQEHLAAI